MPAAGMAAPNPPAKQPTVSVGDTQVVEGDSGTTPATFSVTLSAAPRQDVTVGYRTVDGIADSNDYVSVSGSLVIPRGQTTAQVVVQVKGDTEVEPDETFFVTLDSARNAAINDGTGQGTILDDDTPPPPPTWTLTAAPSGNGSGAITSSPAGIDCGSTCRATYDDGTVVTLTATPAPGSTFDGWSGACTGSGPCTVAMDADKSVTASFGGQAATPPSGDLLSVTCVEVLDSLGCDAAAGGLLSPASVTSSPAGIACSSADSLASGCSTYFPSGSTVTLTEEPGSFRFQGWTGACQGTQPTCTVTLSGDTSVGARFL